jgi:hypothetical protein
MAFKLKNKKFKYNTGNKKELKKSFKLGKEKNLQVVSGEIKTKLSFKDDGPIVPGTRIIRKDLEPGILGEANMDGTIYISKTIEEGSDLEKQVVNHEMRHATDIKIGKLAYTDDYVKYDGIKYPRKDINGRDMIKVDGKWKEAGTHGFPWERKANIGNEHI